MSEDYVDGVPLLIKRGTPIERQSLFETSKAIDTDWFASNIGTIYVPCIHLIWIMMATTSVVRIEMDDGAVTDKEMKLEKGTALTAGCLYGPYTLGILEGQTYNIQHATGTQNVLVTIMECPLVIG